MSTAHATDIDDDVESSDDYDSYDLDELLERASSRKSERRQSKPRSGGSWRDIEDYMEAKRLKRQLSEFYDDDF